MTATSRPPASGPESAMLVVAAGMAESKGKGSAMSDDEKPGDVISFLVAFSRRLYREMRGESGNPARTAFVRVAALLVVLVCGGPILWAALWSMPTALAVLIALFVAFRVARWYLRR